MMLLPSHMAAISLSSYDISRPSGPIVPQISESMPILGTLKTEGMMHGCSNILC